MVGGSTDAGSGADVVVSAMAGTGFGAVAVAVVGGSTGAGSGADVVMTAAAGTGFGAGVVTCFFVISANWTKSFADLFGLVCFLFFTHACYWNLFWDRFGCLEISFSQIYHDQFKVIWFSLGHCAPNSIT